MITEAKQLYHNHYLILIRDAADVTAGGKYYSDGFTYTVERITARSLTTVYAVAVRNG